MRWQVLHSKVCSSKPRLPGEIRANPILCLQVRHIGRSTMEDELRIAQHPRKRYELSTNWSVRCPTLRQDFDASLKVQPERRRGVRRPPRTACQNHVRIAIWRPEAQTGAPEAARRQPWQAPGARWRAAPADWTNAPSSRIPNHGGSRGVGSRFCAPLSHGPSDRRRRLATRGLLPSIRPVVDGRARYRGNGSK